MKATSLALLALAGCSYGNPWDTSSDAQNYEEEVDRGVRMKLIEPYQGPNLDPARFDDPNLETWSDTVLATADEETLRRMRGWAVFKIKDLERRRAEILRADEHNRKVLILDVEQQLAVEQRRLQMIEERQNGDILRRNN